MPDSGVENTLRGIELFARLEPASLAELAAAAEHLFLPGGDVLLTEGEPSDALYVVSSGRLQAFVTSEGHQLLVGEIQRGEVIGEMGILANEPRSATVKALRDSNLLRFPKELFVEFLQRHPSELLAVTQLLIQRLRRSIRSGPIASSVQAIAVVPLDGSNGAMFARLLTSAIAERGRSRMVTADDVDPTMTEGQLVSHLYELEAAHDLLVYLADREPSAWTERCLRQADRVVLVGDSDGDPSITEVERRLLQSDHGAHHARVDLVLVVPGYESQPKNAARWLANRSIHRHHHVQLHSRDHVHRVARALTGREIAVVLSGGGARGLAHIGIMRAMTEHGIPADVVAGASFGAIVSGGVAMGLDWKQQRELAWELLVAKGSMVDVTAPAVAFARGAKAGEQLRAAFGDMLIEDMWLPYFCVSSNLSRGEVTVHKSGPAWLAVRASVSIPGLWPPVLSTDGDILVDGGVMNNLPVDVMESFYDGGAIVAVNLRGTVTLPSVDLPTSGVVSGWSTILRRLNPMMTTPEMPGIADILLRSTETGNVLAAKRMATKAHVVFNPPVGDFGLLAFEDLDRIADAGYQHALEELPKHMETFARLL